ncbi:MAG: hypothetical protein WA771_09995 [Chthoniobacterales bacterium]
MNEVSDTELDDSMDRFEAASNAHSVLLPQIELNQVLVAPDGSNQDTLTAALADHFEVPVQSADVTGNDPPYRQILQQAAAIRAGLIVVPAPFREDFAELGAASIGSNLDLLLHHRATPLLVVRDPARDLAALVREIVIPLSVVAADDIRAAAWAFRALTPRGRIRLLAVADTERLVRDRHVSTETLEFDTLDESDLSGLDQPEMAGLVAAVQRHAAETDVGCRVSIRVGQSVKATAEFTNDLQCLIVATCPLGSDPSGVQAIHALTRLSKNPILIV